MENIKDYINSLTPAQFERLCVDLLRKMKPNIYRIIGTRYIKDGGKDIVGTIDNVPYEIWAECKKHSRPLGLDEISKNVVLVISKDINELFFFSTSKITNNAKKHISIVATKHGLKIAFYDGENLINALSILPQFSDIITNKSHDILAVEYHLSKYKDDDIYAKNNHLILHRDCYFYLDLFLKNNSLEKCENIVIKISKHPHFKFTLREIDNDISIYPYNDRVIQIKGEILNLNNIQKLPDVIIEYKNKDKNKKIILKMGTVDPTHLNYFPLIGEVPNTFLMNVKPLLSDRQNNESYLINILGKSGNGKSRLLKELSNIATDHGWHVISFDAKKNNDYIIIKELSCVLMGLPYNKGSVEFSEESILKILNKRNADTSFSKSLYSFIFENATSENNTYFVKQAILNFLIHPLFNERYILTFDNVQDLSKDMLDMLKFFTDNLSNKKSNCIIVTSTNTELIPEKNKENVDSFIGFLECLPNDYCITYHCNDLNNNDAKSLYMHALNTNNSELVDLLIKKSGSRPFDIIMLVRFLQEQNTIQKYQYTSYITDFDKFQNKLNDIPVTTKNLLEQRVKKIKESMSVEYWDTFKTIVKCLLYFKGNVPLSFISYIDIDEDIISEINDSLFIKFCDDIPAISFFHDNIYRYFEKKKTYYFDGSLAKEINSWILNNPEFPLDNRDLILFKTYIDMFNYEKAKKCGLIAINNAYLNRNYYLSSEIGGLLLNQKQIALSKQENFDLQYIVASSQRERTNHIDGAKLFLKTYTYMKENANDICIPNQVYCKFMHDCINAQINANTPEIAIALLDDFKNFPHLNKEYRFLLHNRYAVAYLAIGETDKAESSLLTAEKIANKIKSRYYKSIIYSDMAFFYFNAIESRDKTLHYFKKAYQYFDESPDDPTRWGEVLQQNALCFLLENNTQESLSVVNKSIERCEEVGNTFLIIKALTLKGIVYAFLNQYDDALAVMNQTLMLCEKTHSIIGKIKTYTNLAALHILSKKHKKAQEYIDIALELFKETSFSVIKHKPLFYNYITINSKSCTFEELFNNLSPLNNDKLLNALYNVMEYSKSIESLNEYGVIKKENAIFNY